MPRLTNFKEQQVEFPTHYTVESTNRGDEKIKSIVPAFGTIREQGTPETSEIYNGIQLGNVHTLQATKSTNLGIDYYSCNLEGLTEFGLKTDLKIRLTVNSENENDNPKLQLNGIDYTLLKEFNGTLKALESKDFKQNKTYELTYNGSQFVVINIEEINFKIWFETIGGQFGGYVSKVQNKEAGKLYINDVYDNKLYVCVTAHSSTSFDITKYRDVTNNGISDQLRNLYNFAHNLKQFDIGRGAYVIKIGKICIMTWDSNNTIQGEFGRGAILLNVPEECRPVISISFPVAVWNSPNSATARLNTNGTVTWESSINYKGAVYANVSWISNN